MLIIQGEQLLNHTYACGVPVRTNLDHFYKFSGEHVEFKPRITQPY